MVGRGEGEGGEGGGGDRMREYILPVVIVAMVDQMRPSAARRCIQSGSGLEIHIPSGSERSQQRKWEMTMMMISCVDQAC